MSACAEPVYKLHLNSQTQYFKGYYPVRAVLAITCVAGLSLGGCSINDDLRSFQSTIPARIGGLAWVELVPLGAFAPLQPFEAAPDGRSLAARAAALRLKATTLLGPVLDASRARAMRAALRRASAG